MDFLYYLFQPYHTNLQSQFPAYHFLLVSLYQANLKLFVGMGAAEKLKNPGELLKVVKDIKFSPDKLSDMRRNLESFKGINSAEKIAVLIEGIK